MNTFRISSRLLVRQYGIQLNCSNSFSTVKSSRLLDFRHDTGLFCSMQKRNESSDTNVKPLELLANENSTSWMSSITNKLGALSDAPYTHFLENQLVNLHDLELFEWSATIFIAALSFRLLVCLPVKIYQEHLVVKLTNAQPEVREKFEKMMIPIRKSTQFVSPELKKKINRQRIKIQNEIYARENCQPQKIPISSLLQLPVWMFFTSAIRNLSRGATAHSIAGEQIASESLFWLPSLAIPDPFYVLPVVFATFALTNIKYSSLNDLKSMNLILNVRKYAGIGLIGVMALLITHMPSSVGLFWVSSNFLHLVETIALDSITVRRFLKIPKISQEPPNVYAYKYNILAKQFKNISNKFK